ncbi:MAG: DUF5990 family protein [Alphaproteobacteria bacterium]|nr:DUF5990 family protein [Alphaproteobacteria bacterium]
MPRYGETEIRLRLIVENPVPGVLHSLQDKKSAPVDQRSSDDGAAIVFEFAVRVAPGPNGPRFLGEFVRSEGPERRFVYIAIGKQAGDAGSCWDRRMKIDIHALQTDLLDQAKGGAVLEAVIAGKGGDGTPACATVLPVRGWQAV